MFAVDKQMEAGLERGCATVGVTWAGTQGLHKTPGSAPSMQGWGGGRGWALVCERGTAADSHISCPPSEGSSASLHLTPQMGWEADEPEYV